MKINLKYLQLKINFFFVIIILISYINICDNMNYKIDIDTDYGGDDSGAVGNGIIEKI